MAYEKFDVAKLERLNDPARFDLLDPGVMWTALGRPEPSVIVDIGAGTGMFAARFAELAPTARVYAADNHPAMVEWMKEYRAPSVGERFVPVLSSEESVPLPDGTADLVVMINLHHELVSPSAIYAEAARLLKPGGQVLVADWAPGAEGGGPPQAVRSGAEDILGVLVNAGFVDGATHDGLTKHSLITARRR